MKMPLKLIVSVFYIGFIPRIPGTAASLAGLLVFYFLHDYGIFLFSLIFLSGLLGFAFCGKAEKLFGEKDAPFIVIDEFFAMLFVLMFVRPAVAFLILAFVVFRIVDILKFWPIKKIEKLAGSRGIMLDDCVAGVYTVLIVRLLTCFF